MARRLSCPVVLALQPSGVVRHRDAVVLVVGSDINAGLRLGRAPRADCSTLASSACTDRPPRIRLRCMGYGMYRRSGPGELDRKRIDREPYIRRGPRPGYRSGYYGLSYLSSRYSSSSSSSLSGLVVASDDVVLEQVKRDRDILALAIGWAVMPTVILAIASLVHPIYVGWLVSASAPGIALLAAFVCVRAFPKSLDPARVSDRVAYKHLRSPLLTKFGAAAAVLLAVGYRGSASAQQEDLLVPHGT